MAPIANTATYFVTAVLCIAATWLTAPRPWLLIPLVSGPLAFVSIALGLTLLFRRARGAIEAAISFLWGLGALALSVYLSSPPMRFEHLFLGALVRGYLVCAAAAALVVAAARTLLDRSVLPWRPVATVAYVPLAFVLGRLGLMELGAVASGGLERIQPEMELLQWACIASGGISLLAALVPRLGSAWENWRRPTTACT
jgi:hypothetical protein